MVRWDILGIGAGLGAIIIGATYCESKKEGSDKATGIKHTKELLIRSETLRLSGKEDEALENIANAIKEQKLDLNEFIHLLSTDFHNLKLLIEEDLEDEARGIPTTPIGIAHRRYIRERLKSLGGGQKAMIKASREWREEREAVEKEYPSAEDKRIAQLIIERLEKKTGVDVPSRMELPSVALVTTPEGKKVKIPKGSRIDFASGD